MCIPLFAFPFLLQAQEADDAVTTHPPVKNIIKISPFHFVEGTFLMSYERMLNEQKSSIMVSLGLNSRERSWNNSSQFGFQEEIQYRVYVAPPKDVGARGRNFMFFKGFYAGPYISHRFRSTTEPQWDWITQQNSPTKTEINEVSGGVLMGVQIAFANKVFADFFLGGGVKRSFGEVPQGFFIDITQPGYNGVIPKIGLQIGIGL